VDIVPTVCWLEPSLEPEIVESMQPAARPLVVIAVPTYRRPEMLLRCLESLQALQLPDGLCCLLLVVDNDSEGSARTTFDRARGALEAHYVIEPERGLSRVRNRLLDESASRGADWIACIDDDEVVEPGWLAAYWRARALFPAEIYTGPVVRLPWGADPASAATAERPVRPDGSEPGKVWTCNVLFAHGALGMPPLRFNPGLNLTGGEDEAFFNALRRTGARACWVQDAAVIEWQSSERLTLRYAMQRHYRQAISAVCVARLQDSAARVWQRFGLKAIGKLLGVLTALCLIPLAPRRNARLSALRLSTALGTLVGLGGARPEPYRETDGY
jgi:succinoglycan biosynthesis protein ExoM